MAHSAAASVPDLNMAHIPQGFASPNSQRLLEKKIKSMRLLGEFKDLMGNGEGEGEALKRFGSD